MPGSPLQPEATGNFSDFLPSFAALPRPDQALSRSSRTSCTRSSLAGCAASGTAASDSAVSQVTELRTGELIQPVPLRDLVHLDATPSAQPPEQIAVEVLVQVLRQLRRYLVKEATEAAENGRMSPFHAAYMRWIGCNGFATKTVANGKQVGENGDGKCCADADGRAEVMNDSHKLQVFRVGAITCLFNSLIAARRWRFLQSLMILRKLWRNAGKLAIPRVIDLSGA